MKTLTKDDEIEQLRLEVKTLEALNKQLRKENESLSIEWYWRQQKGYKDDQQPANAIVRNLRAIIQTEADKQYRLAMTQTLKLTAENEKRKEDEAIRLKSQLGQGRDIDIEGEL